LTEKLESHLKLDEESNSDKEQNPFLEVDENYPGNKRCFYLTIFLFVFIAVIVISGIILIAILIPTYLHSPPSSGNGTGGNTPKYRVSWGTCEHKSGAEYTKALQIPLSTPSGATETAIFAAGCFWSIELLYQRIPAVLGTCVGYTGGKTEHPTYDQVCMDTTGHAEVVRIDFDPSVISYSQLVKVFFEQHDPTTLNRQGNDVGKQYRSAIFFLSETQYQIAEQEKQIIQKQLAKSVQISISNFHESIVRKFQFL